MTSTGGGRSRRRLLIPSLVGLALISSACTGRGTSSPPRASPSGSQAIPRPVLELTSIDTLRDAFNDDAGSTRLILLISPT